MDDEFGTWDCSWYWDNSYADLSQVGTGENSQHTLHCIVQGINVLSVTFVES